MTGEWPVLQIDHIDLDKRNNRWNNLRLATNSENQCNQSTHRNNTSGFKGVWLRRANGTWISEIKKDGIKHHLGTFKTPEEASDAYKAAASKLHGKFARH